MERNPWRDPVGGSISGDDADGESAYSILTPPEALSDVEELDGKEWNPEESDSYQSKATGRDATVPTCAHCNENHYRRRLIICADGALYDFSNAKGGSSEELQPSSIYRISKVIETGSVFDILSTAIIDQTTIYKPGLGAEIQPQRDTNYNDSETDITWVEQDQIVTENLLKESVRDIYITISRATLCASDEVFLFGEGMGATALVVTARLLHFRGRLKLETCTPSIVEDAHEAFETAWESYIQFSNEDQMVSDEDLFCQAPNIGFMGLVETQNLPTLRDICTTIFDNAAHTYQALGLSERNGDAARLQLSPGSSDAVVAEGWFFGNRLDLDGTRCKNGLSLWPLQWLVAEARGKGLVLSSGSSSDSADWEDMNISELFLPQEGNEYPFWFSNGISVNIWDISPVFKVENHQLEFQRRWVEMIPGMSSQRSVFGDDGGLLQYDTSNKRKTIIHPSVFYHIDQFSTDRNWSCYRKEIDDFRSTKIDVGRSRFFWTSKRTLPHKLRILVCGNEGVGKSSLINSVFNTDKATVTREEQTKHDIEKEVVVHKIDGEDSIIIHDSNGFETGDVEKNKEAEAFIEKRCYQADQNEQLHCIWYCIKSDNPRKGDKSIQSIFSKCFREWKIPLVIVYTQSLRHEGAMEADIKAKYRKMHGRNARIREDDLVSELDRLRSEIWSIQDGWINETYVGSLNEMGFDEQEVDERRKSALRIQRTDIGIVEISNPLARVMKV
ncbi:hypothetical protein ABW19_dt0203119 [Dactylella cylindrospora]|nr:hypothetical protein ABW19_dt0203119 [Dactylella cylindrospora]